MITQMLIMINLFNFNLMFSMIKHPMMMAMILLIQTFLISLMMGISSQSFWFSYILFLIFIGGMLIIFLYMIMLVSNKKFKYLNFFMFWMLMMLIFTFIYFLFKNNIFLFYYLNNFDNNLFNSSMFLNYENSINLNKFYNLSNNFMNILLMNYLFFMLVIIVKMISFKKGPLKLKF